MFTCNGAYGIFEENRKGSLEQDKLADIVILDKNILKVKKEKIKDIKVNYTLKSGNVVFDRFKK